MDRATEERLARMGSQQEFARRNGSGVMVPGRLAGDGGGGNHSVAVAVIPTAPLNMPFLFSLASMSYVLGRMGMPFNFVMGVEGELPAQSRNEAAEAAKKNNCGFVLFMESGLGFPPDAVVHLLQAAVQGNLDIVGITVAARNAPHNNVAVPKGGETAIVNGLVEVDELPLAFVLVRTSVFEKLERPYFWNLMERGSGTLKPDSSVFCEEARGAGFKIWLHAGLSATFVSWGQCGYRLTVSDDPEAQFERVEFGEQHKPAAPDAANESRIEVAK